MLKPWLFAGMLWLPLFAQDWAFEEVSAQAGLAFEHAYSGVTEPEFMAGGAAVADIEGDGDLDLMVVGGSRGDNALFVNQGDGTFVNRAAEAGLVFADRFDNAPTFADVNGDGFPDLFLGSIKGSGPKLLMNNGDGSFRDATAASGLIVSADVYGATFGDPDRDGDLDLMLAYWAEHHQDYYWRNDGTGRFTPADEAVGISAALADTNAFTPSFSDINNDGWPDLLVVADFRTTTYFINRGGGFFVEGDRTPITDGNGMGSAVGDIDNDGDLDWFVSSVGVVEGNPNQDPTGNRMYRNKGDGTFEDATEACGVREGHWGWGSTFGDFDNDGDLDLFHVNGFLGSFSAGYDQDASKLFINDGSGVFSEQAVALGIDDRLQGRGVVAWDYDRDGDLDLLVTNNAGPLRLFRNNGGNQNNYLRLKPRVDGMEALGARITIEYGGQQAVREISNGGNYVSQNPAIAHFGLGKRETVDRVTVRWPDGVVTTHGPFNAGGEHSLDRTLGLSCAAPATTRTVAHLTSLDGGFDTQLRLYNGGAEPAEVSLTALNDTGIWVGAHQLSLEPGQAANLNSHTVFGDVKAAQLRLTAPSSVSLQSGYRRQQEVALLATASHGRAPANRFAFYSGNPDLVFDGIALVNSGESAARVTLRRFDARGALVEEKTLHEALPRDAKGLHLLNDLFASVTEGERFEISADRPLHLTVLRGTWPNQTPAVLFTVPTEDQTDL
ncbi:CRTAC1 family protein [Acanthopleuribacter pedis]|uniref:CRTAC1 family protein n=1 Tax=Acanthopleuribacter pedis TaxID=442870 RepID=A0A8J7QAZ8_9BACT|nr:CRTAC1 family protein [Acanthopleuribacter pedis]MBO1320769.1 CRTAC1 family protein [Acanthopleuribacter pedis]